MRPTVTTNKDVRIVVNFSEEVLFNNAPITASDWDWLTVEGGRVDINSLETPRDGRPAGEYSFVVTPDANSQRSQLRCAYSIVR